MSFKNEVTEWLARTRSSSCKVTGTMGRQNAAGVWAHGRHWLAGSRRAEKGKFSVRLRPCICVTYRMIMHRLCSLTLPDALFWRDGGVEAL